MEGDGVITLNEEPVIPRGVVPRDRQPAASRRPSAGAVVRLMRPRQWIKNGLVLAAAGAAGALGRDDVPQRVLVATLAFCLLSSGIYAINDARDVAEDRLHPRKCRRPVAAGEISPTAALWLGAALVAVGLVASLLITPALALVAAAYVALTVTYTLVWRRIPVLDLFAVSGGFVLRAVAGGVAAGVPLSRWFVLVVSAASFCLATGKRLAELRRANMQGTRRRRSLRGYSVGGLRAVLIAAATVALIGYVEWAQQALSVNGVPWRALTIAPFALSLVRYLILVQRGEGEAPEEMVLGDMVLLAGGVAWLVLFGLAVHAGS